MPAGVAYPAMRTLDSRGALQGRDGPDRAQLCRGGAAPRRRRLEEARAELATIATQLRTARREQRRDRDHDAAPAREPGREALRPALMMLLAAVASGPADRVRERREHAAGARGRAPARAGHSSGARREPQARMVRQLLVESRCSRSSAAVAGFLAGGWILRGAVVGRSRHVDARRRGWDRRRIFAFLDSDRARHGLGVRPRSGPRASQIDLRDSLAHGARVAAGGRSRAHPHRRRSGARHPAPRRAHRS